MARDHQFEIQYLISLTIAVLAIITIEGIRQYLDVWLGYLLLFTISIHFVLFNIYYTFGEAVEIELDAVNWLQRESRWTWGLITGLFLFLILHTVFGNLLVNFTECSMTVNNRLPNSLVTVNCVNAKILIAYALPLLIVGAMGVHFGRKIWSPFRTLRDVNIKIAPSHLKIFSTAKDTEPLFIKVENEGSKKFDYEINVSLPEGVNTEYNGSSISEKLTSESVIEPGRQDRFDLPLEYSGREMRSDLIEVEIEHETGTKTKDIEVLLVPQ